MTTYHRDVTAEVRIDIQEGSDAITRATDPSHEFYDSFLVHTETEMIDLLAKYCVWLGVDDASRLDGWGDLDRGVVTMRVLDVWAD